MFNLLLSYNNTQGTIKTLHLNEETAEMSTRISNINNLEDLKWLDNSTKKESTICNYGVRKVDKGLAFLHSCSDNINFEYEETLTKYTSKLSLIGLIRKLVNLETKIVYQGKLAEEYFDLTSLKGSNRTLNLTIPVLTEIDFDEYVWRSCVLLFYNPLNEFREFDNIEFLLPKTDLGGYEQYVKRTGTKTIGKLIFDTLKIIPSNLPIVSEKPMCFTSLQLIGAVQLMINVYDLFIPLLSENLFEPKNIIKEPYSYSSLKGTGGFVEIKSNYKVNAALRTKYMNEIASINQFGENSSELLKNSPLFQLFFSLCKSLSKAIASKQELLMLYRSIRLSSALINLLLYEIKYSLFFYDTRYLSLLNSLPLVETGIENYNLNFRAGGTQWQPIKL